MNKSSIEELNERMRVSVLLSNDTAGELVKRLGEGVGVKTSSVSDDETSKKNEEVSSTASLSLTDRDGTNTAEEISNDGVNSSLIKLKDGENVNNELLSTSNSDDTSEDTSTSPVVSISILLETTVDGEGVGDIVKNKEDSSSREVDELKKGVEIDEENSSKIEELISKEGATNSEELIIGVASKSSVDTSTNDDDPISCKVEENSTTSDDISSAEDNCRVSEGETWNETTADVSIEDVSNCSDDVGSNCSTVERTKDGEGNSKDSCGEGSKLVETNSSTSEEENGRLMTSDGDGDGVSETRNSDEVSGTENVDVSSKLIPSSVVEMSPENETSSILEGTTSVGSSEESISEVDRNSVIGIEVDSSSTSTDTVDERSTSEADVDSLNTSAVSS